jgi:spore coat polysaccharide biosynthesis protein SpsF (cytidylyltransferase family)
MTTAVIVQARMGSSRLPGKVLMRLGGESVLSHLLRRCRAIRGVDVVCCATTDAAEDDVVAEEAERAGAMVYRGSASDVLARYQAAAHAMGCDIVLRVTADCPLIDPHICASVLDLRLERTADFACNNMPPSWPHGLDCEAFTTALLDEAAGAARTTYEREHVTPWMRAAPHVSKVNLPGPGGAAADQRWTLDYPEDKAMFDALFAYLPERSTGFDWRAISDLIRAHPEIAAMNRSRRDPRRLETASAAPIEPAGARQ